MGIEYKAAIMVGLPREAFMDLDQLEEWLDNEDLEVCAPYYDAIVGLHYRTSADYAAIELVWDQGLIDRKLAEFKELTGMDGKVWLSPLGY